MRRQPGFFDIDHRMKRLSDLGDQLEAFGSAVDFEIFRGNLNVSSGLDGGRQGGRPPFDPVLMFKILVIQATNNLSDERTEFLINDRLSFMRFLGLGLEDRVPDARTIWLFREKLHQGRGDQEIVRAVRCSLRAGWLYRHVGSDRRCQPDCGAASAQYGRREEGDQRGPYTGELEGQARQAAAQGSRRALDGQIHQGQTARGWLNAASRSGNPALWLSEPYLDRSPFRLHPPMGGHRCGCL